MAQTLNYNEVKQKFPEIVDKAVDISLNTYITIDERPVAIIANARQYQIMQATLSVITSTSTRKALKIGKKQVGENKVKDLEDAKEVLNLIKAEDKQQVPENQNLLKVIKITEQAIETLQSYEKEEQSKLIRSLEAIQMNPSSTIPLKAGFKGMWMLQTLKHRLIYKVDNGKITVLMMEDRPSEEI